MTPNKLDRLEAVAIPPTPGKHLIFRVEAPRGTPVGDIVAFLKDQGHAIHGDDDVFVMNLGAHGMAEGDRPRDLSSDLLTEEMRSASPAAGKWPMNLHSFTFNLHSPRVLR